MLAVAKRNLHNGKRVLLKQLARQLLQGHQLGLTKVEQQGHLILRVTGKGLVQRLIHAIEHHELLFPVGDLIDGTQGGQDAVAAGLGEQCAVVTDTLIIVVATQIDYLGIAGGLVAAMVQVITNANDAFRGEIGGPI